MKRILPFVIAIAALALAGFTLYKTKNIGKGTVLGANARSEQEETVAYLSDFERRIAMFIVPVNYTTNGPWTAFELKASTNDFCHGRPGGQQIPERVYMQYFMDSDVADTGGLFNPDCMRDRAKLYICNENLEDVGLEFRSYTRIANTLQLNPTPNKGVRDGEWDPDDYAPNPLPRSRHVEEVVVLIDTCDLVRYPEPGGWAATNGVWLTWNNNNLMWVYGRKGNSWWEEAHGTKPMWRPIAPVRWFKEMPNWAQLADEEYYIHHPTNAPTAVNENGDPPPEEVQP